LDKTVKFLIPVVSPDADAVYIDHIAATKRGGADLEIVLLSVQPRFNRRVAELSRRADRDAFRAERGRGAMAGLMERLSAAGVRFRALTVMGYPPDQIAAVAEEESVQEILVAVRRAPAIFRTLTSLLAREVRWRTPIPVTVLWYDREEHPGVTAGAASFRNNGSPSGTNAGTSATWRVPTG
jgi:hypothetical protein